MAETNEPNLSEEDPKAGCVDGVVYLQNAPAS
jgi:hypothetical protein